MSALKDIFTDSTKSARDKAEAFYSILNAKDCKLKKADILAHLTNLIDNKWIAITPILQRYEITLEDARKTCDRFLTRILDKKGCTEFDRVIAHYKTNVCDTLRTIANVKDLFTMSWLLEKFNLPKKDVFKFARKCIKDNNVANFQWAMHSIDTEVGEIMENKLFYQAVKHNRLSILEWLNSQYKITKSDALYNFQFNLAIAASHGHLEIMKWLAEAFNVTKEDIIMHGNRVVRWAAENGRLDVLKWLEMEYELTTDDLTAENNAAFDIAKKNGHLEVCRWIQVKEKSPVAAFVAKMTPAQQSRVLWAILSGPHYYPPEDIRIAIDSVCVNDNTFYNQARVDMLDIISRAYDLKNMEHDDAVETLRRICANSRFPHVVQYLYDEGVLAKPIPKPTVKQIKEFYPGHVFAKPEEIVEWIEKRFA